MLCLRAASECSPKEAEWRYFLFRQGKSTTTGQGKYMEMKREAGTIRGLIHLPDNVAHSRSAEDWQPTNHCCACFT